MGKVKKTMKISESFDQSNQSNRNSNRFSGFSKKILELESSTSYIGSSSTAETTNFSITDVRAKKILRKYSENTETKTNVKFPKKFPAHSSENIYEPSELSDIQEVLEKEEKLNTFRKLSKDENLNLLQQDI